MDAAGRTFTERYPNLTEPLPGHGTLRKTRRRPGLHLGPENAQPAVLAGRGGRHLRELLRELPGMPPLQGHHPHRPFVTKTTTQWTVVGRAIPCEARSRRGV